MLDIATPAGRLTLADEAAAAELFTGHQPRFRYVETPKDKPALVDALLLRGDELFAVVETKCRNESSESFFQKFGGRWLVTLEKVLEARKTAVALQLPLVGFLYLNKDKTLLVQKIAEPDGKFVASMVIKTTETQATCNGGTAIRTNAYIDMTKAKVYR